MVVNPQLPTRNGRRFCFLQKSDHDAHMKTIVAGVLTATVGLVTSPSASRAQTVFE
jgi:hypothetical protein